MTAGADLGPVRASAGGSAPERSERRAAHGVHRRAGEPQRVSTVVPDVPVPAQSQPPLGSATAGSGGGLGAPASAGATAFLVLVMSVSILALRRFSLDLAPWRSTLLASRLEHPG
jgi:hypothetical protein